MTDYVEIFKDAAERLDYKFFYGSKGYQNFELQQAEISEGTIILIMFPAKRSPIVEGGQWSRYSISTQFFLGRKFECDTVSSIDETEYQKYTNRLKELSDLLDEFLLNNVGCADRLEARSINYFDELNQYSASIDFAGASITFDAW
jgi:hypothetical protein